MRLIRDAKAGCVESMELLIKECQPYLLAIANAEIDPNIAPKVGASDIVQNSILSAQRCIGDFDGETRQELLSWLRGILANDLQQTNRFYRAEKRYVGREQPLPDDLSKHSPSRLIDRTESPSTLMSDREQEALLYRALSTLRDEERQVIELRNWQRLSFVQIGVHMDRSADAVRKLWSRAVIRLQSAMDGDNV